MPQDVPGLIALMGGREKFAAKLDLLFTFPAETKGLEDVQGRIGEYWHGNEPSHHIIYLYCYAGQPWKAPQRLHEVVKTQYGNKPDSLIGQRRLRPDVGLVHFHRPGFLSGLPGERLLRPRQPGPAEGHRAPFERQDAFDRRPKPFRENIYVQSLVVNGKAWTSPFLPYREIKDGGHLVFTMGPEPNRQWGVEARVPE